MPRPQQWRYLANGLILDGETLPESVKRYMAVVEYNGGQYCGWQRQSHSPSVQSQVEQALSKVANDAITVVCAGRTDTGVHATNQIIHFDSSANRAAHNWLRGANTVLPDGICLHWVAEVPAQFHARFSAISRTYQYIISTEPARPALFSGLITWSRSKLDVEAMHSSAQSLLGENDFSSFRAAGCQSNTPFRCIESLTVKGDAMQIVIEIKANAFLHHMVRNIVGALMVVGKGEKPVEWMAQLLALKDRTQGEITAPAEGLYLVAVEYPQRFGLPVFPYRLPFG